jgi:hypothetical protein
MRKKAKVNILSIPQYRVLNLIENHLKQPLNINTTKLLSGNLTDFIEDVRRDILKNKYGGELKNCVIEKMDLMQFLKKITNNFDKDSVLMVYDSINEAIDDIPEEVQKEQPLIFQQLTEVLFDYINTDTPNDTGKQPPITIPDNMLNELQNTTCKNGKPFIENAAVRPLKWLQNKQLLRELLTHDKIKGTLTIAEVERQTPKLFINKHGNPLTLASNKVEPDGNRDLLNGILATL